jgi:hypothetical protein
MLGYDPLLCTHLAEYRSLLLVVSSHSYFLSAFPVHLSFEIRFPEPLFPQPVEALPLQNFFVNFPYCFSGGRSKSFALVSWK